MKKVLSALPIQLGIEAITSGFAYEAQRKNKKLERLKTLNKDMWKQKNRNRYKTLEQPKEPYKP